MKPQWKKQNKKKTMLMYILHTHTCTHTETHIHTSLTLMSLQIDNLWLSVQAAHQHLWVCYAGTFLFNQLPSCQISCKSFFFFFFFFQLRIHHLVFLHVPAAACGANV